MVPFASGQNIDSLRASADIIEEVDGVTTYLGFCQPGTLLTSDPKWSIMQIVEGAALPKLTVFKWATGSCAYNLIWDNRAGYAYTFKNF